MASLVITDDCLTPDRYIYVRYSGPNPWDVVKKVTGSIRGFFHVSASGTNNTRLNWDITGDPTTFYSLWWVKKDFSRFTRMWLWIKIQGEQSKTSKEGKFSMQLNADLRTVFEGWGIFIKPIWYMYSYLFYNRARRRYLDRCREYVQGFRDMIKEHYNLKTASAPITHTALG